MSTGAARTLLEADRSFMLTSFGELITAQKTPEMQYSFPIHIDPEEIIVDSDSTNGTVSAADDIATVSTSTDTNGSITLKTRRHSHYYAGQGIIVQFSAIFPTPTSGHTYAMGLGNENDGVFFGSDGTNFGTILRKDGSDTFTARSSWEDPLDGTGPTKGSFTLTNGNVYFIQIMWHGMGNIFFYVFDKKKRIPTLVHTQEFADSGSTGTSMGNPALPFMIRSIKTSGSTNFQIKTASFGVFSEGKVQRGERKRAKGVRVTGITADTETAILTIRDRTTVLGVTNSSEIIINRVSVSNEGSRTHIYRIYKNSNLSSASWTNVNECSSIAEVSTNGTRDAVVTSTTAQAVSATTITLASGASSTDDFYNGRSLVITSADTGANQCREILDYNGTTKVATVVAWETTPTGTVKYVIENGVEIGGITTAKDNAYVDDLGIDTEYHLSPGETLTITVESAGSTEVRATFGWNELL